MKIGVVCHLCKKKRSIPNKKVCFLWIMGKVYMKKDADTGKWECNTGFGCKKDL